MKKLFCFALALLSLFSCVIFSACGDKYKNLSISFFNESNEDISSVDFLIDTNEENGFFPTQKLGIEFGKIDKEDVGQILVYSEPFELVDVSNYTYDGEICYVDLTAKMPSSDGAKIVVTHLVSGKKKSIPLNIEQRSNNLSLKKGVANSDPLKYVVSIPKEGEKEHFVDMTKLVSLLPTGSTDEVFFKLVEAIPEEQQTNISIIELSEKKDYLQNTDYGKLGCGFKVNSETSETRIKIYPVTYLKGYNNESLDEYAGKEIVVEFKKELTNDMVAFSYNKFSENPETDESATVEETLKLVVNDKTACSIVLTPQVFETSILNSGLLEFYDVELNVEDSQRISALFDETNGVIIISANQQTPKICEIGVVLKPKNAVGDICQVAKTISVEGISKPENIKVFQDGDLVEIGEYVDIFNYYEDGNSLGSLFKFEATALSGMPVDKELRNMQLVVDYDILSLNNLKEKPLDSNQNPKGKFALEFYVFGRLLKFDAMQEGEKAFKSETISAGTDIYVKYINVSGGTTNNVLSMTVQTLNELNKDYWNNSHMSIERTINFNAIEGVKEMHLQAGTMKIEAENLVPSHIESIDPECVYLDRANEVKGGQQAHYLHVVKDSLLDMFGQKIDENINFKVEVVSLNGEVMNPLKISTILAIDENKNLDFSSAFTNLTLTHDNDKDNDVVVLLVDKTTSVGRYEIVFSQANIKRTSIICEVYETINSLNLENIDLENNGATILNPIVEGTDRKYNDYNLAEYILPSGEELGVLIRVPSAVIASNMIEDYIFDFELVDETGQTFNLETGTKEDYFQVAHQKDNEAVLNFKKGTFIGKNVYVKISLSLSVNQYTSIIEKGEPTHLETPLNVFFFIYEEILYSDVLLSNRELFKFAKESLGAYNKQHSQATISLEMEDDLWNYVTTKTNWDIVGDFKNSVGKTESEDNRSCDFEFKQSETAKKYSVQITSQFSQFGKTFQFVCDAHVDKPNITTEVIIQSPLEITDEIDEKYYINLKDGEEYQIVAKNYSNLGEVTHKGLLIRIVDEFGVGFHTDEYFHINQEKQTITVKKIDNKHNFKVVVFAQDALNKYITGQDNLNDPASYLLVWDSVMNPNQFKKAFFVAELKLSNGTEANPFLIKNEQDFWEIDDEFPLLEKHYMLMTGLNFKTMQAPIKNFSGSLRTYNYNLYQISGIKLNNENHFLFENILSTGKISEIQFNVTFDYNLSLADNEITLGVIGKNSGTLRNVGVVVNGTANLQTTTTTIFNFGGLVGHNTNDGRIEYRSKLTDGEEENPTVLAEFNNVNGAQGIINLSGNASVNFGGLVGVNNGLISGAEKEAEATENNIVFSTGSGRTNAMSFIKIQSSLSENSAMGGLVGSNTGLIQNAFVQANITAENATNVGGVIGKNAFSAQQVKISRNAQNTSLIYLEETTLDSILENKYDNKIYNVKSASIVSGGANVGGIVGHDTNGFYLDCDFQILGQIHKTATLKGVNNVGGIAGYSEYGKFLYCSVMSYNWAYEMLKTNGDNMIGEGAYQDIEGNDYVGGIVGYSESDNAIQIQDGDLSETRTLVAYSSVNAFIKSDGQVGGILTSPAGAQPSKSVLIAVTFIGRIDGNFEELILTTYDNNAGNIDHKFALMNNPNIAFVNKIYSINIKDINDQLTLVFGRYNNGEQWKIDELPSDIYFGLNENINGGYLFVSAQKEGGNPIFEVVPESISVTPKNTSTNGVLMLDYYDFTLHMGVTNSQLEKLNKEYNYARALEKLDITVSPSNIGTVTLNIMSTNSQVIEIMLDGTIIIRGVGTCKLILTSVLNSSVTAYVDVVVNYPMGSFDIGSSPNDTSKIITYNTEKIPKGASRQYYAMTSGYVEASNSNGTKEKFSYKTISSVNLKLTVTAKLPAQKAISDYISIVGDVETNKRNEASEPAEVSMTVKILKGNPFMISVVERLESEAFNFTIVPYEIVENTNTNLSVPIEYPKQANFSLYSTLGATKVAFSYDDALVYLNDTITLNMLFETDTNLGDKKKIQNNIISAWNSDGVELSDGILLKIASGKTDLDFESENVLITVQKSEFNQELNSHRIKLIIEFVGLKSENFITDTEKELNITCELAYGNTAQVNYTVLAQRINKIEIKNYYKEKSDDTDLILGDVLKAETPGQIIIDMVPNNAHYTYLEISDITGSDEILFIQLDANGNAISVEGDLSSDRKGIKLYSDSTNSTGRIVVKTQIDNRYSSKIHIIEVRAYYSFSNGDILLHSARKEIDVKMLPKVKVQYVLPSGIDSTEADNSEHKEILLAKGATANLKITTENTTRDFEYLLSGKLKDKFTLVQTSGMHYELTPNTTDMTMGESIILTVNGYADMGLGTYEMATCSMEFKITNFVIHSISVNSSLNIPSNPEIYGYFDKEIKLNFYFDKTDISYYDETTHSDKINDTVYSYVRDIETSVYGDLRQIYSILKELNTTDSYISLIKSAGEVSTLDKVFLAGNTLSVEENYNKDVQLQIAFKVKNISQNSNSPNWKVVPTTDEGQEKNYSQIKKYKLNFRSATNWYEPTVVNSREDFLKMESGERYILNTDLTEENNNQALTDYSPLDLDLLEFDGNGHKIEIQSFAPFQDQEIKAGLFKQIYENMIVKNVVLEYNSKEIMGNHTLGHADATTGKIDFYDFCQNEEVAFTSASFGGITAVNNGVITNCQVFGEIAVNASVLEQSSSGQYAVNLFLGGMVAENSATGYISNSTSTLSIFSQANMGGFAHSNHGKIVSCAVEEGEFDKRTTFYGYNSNLGNTIVVEMSGFVVSNSGDISMSYVNLTANSSSAQIIRGTMSAKDISSGFAYSNTGNITDAYVQISQTGTNNNTFAGFTYRSSGKIERAYSFINNGVLQDKNDVMFAPAGTKNLKNCLEFVTAQSGYDNGNENLTTLDAGHRFNQQSYERLGFAFGGRKNGAVWVIESGQLPKLVSTLEKVVDNSKTGLIKIKEIQDTDISDGQNDIKYKLNFATYGTKENPYIIASLNDWNNYFDENLNIFMNGYYRIVKDINFSTVGGNPQTSKTVFKGNIQGNNMTLDGIMLYSKQVLSSIGLFKELQSSVDSNIENAIRNLTITATSVWASSTSAVGVLAGIVEDFALYNITIDSPNVVMVGKNAVGGLAGIIKGDCDVDQISSNIGANSTRASTLSNYSIYVSKANGNKETNLNKVYYAGAVAGIVDMFNSNKINVNNARDITNHYLKVQNIDVASNSLVLAGDTVGVAFGFLGEKVMLKNANVDITGEINGSQYSSGLVGENRGVIQNANVNIREDVFKKSKYALGGAVGLNLGGLVLNVTVTAFAEVSDYAFTAGGIVARNVYGTISNCHFDGEINAYHTGGIVGANYSSKILRQATTGNGAIDSDCKTYTNLFPTKHVNYTNGGKLIENFSDTSISLSVFNKMLENSSKYYSYENKIDPKSLSDITIEGKVLGVVAGLAFDEFDSLGNNLATVVKKDENTFKILLADDKLIFNKTEIDENTSWSIEFSSFPNENVLLKSATEPENEVKWTFENVNILNLNIVPSRVMYLVGAKSTSLNSWTMKYSEEFILVK